MDRYLDMDGEPALQARREETWKWKEELKGLLKRKAELTTTTVGFC